MARLDTRQQILDLAEELIRSKGYNSFSYHEISHTLGVKNAAVHYHFPTKEVLGLEVIRSAIQRFKDFKEETASLSLEEQLDAFIQTYSINSENDKVCLVGAISVEFYGLPENMTNVMKGLTRLIHDWVTNLLAMGKAEGMFAFDMKPETKATMIITNLAAGVQIARLMGNETFSDLIKGIKTDLGLNK
ncbi:TetR/AcrR family transcriptional regulator [Imperialibacter roseus]|uniref:TetR/AcrR family transcriptional regulator n=1 Tax=Imperialibacter roseus TaxID=1324217 RepID=A0ABZ0ITC6_9BACT|nr:TetR/AcrR family transcriptional regulator [Imperialibacter roseus]WOK07394.1 TetR/AcrR family transcriptional regulator [Imperialibacter roseus]